MKKHTRGLPPLNKTDRLLLLDLDVAVKYAPGVSSGLGGGTCDAYLMARHSIELRLRALCRLSDVGVRARHGLRKQHAIAEGEGRS